MDAQAQNWDDLRLFLAVAQSGVAFGGGAQP